MGVYLYGCSVGLAGQQLAHSHIPWFTQKNAPLHPVRVFAASCDWHATCGISSRVIVGELRAALRRDKQAPLNRGAQDVNTEVSTAKRGEEVKTGGRSKRWSRVMAAGRKQSKGRRVYLSHIFCQDNHSAWAIKYICMMEKLIKTTNKISIFGNKKNCDTKG